MRKKRNIQFNTIKQEIQPKNTLHALAWLARFIYKQKQTLSLLEEETEKASKKLQSVQLLTRHYEKIYQGLERLSTMRDIPEKLQEEKTIVLLKDEIKRLEELARIQEEIIQEHSFSSQIVSVEEPRRKNKKTFDPIILFKTFKKFQEEHQEFRRIVGDARSTQAHFVIGEENGALRITTNGTRKYKAENGSATKAYFKVGERYFTTYYLSDLTGTLYPEPMERLIYSSLPCTISMLIEPTNNAKIIKLLRSRLATLEAKQRERLEKGRIRDHKIDREHEENTTFVEELVHELEKAFDVSVYLTVEGKNEEELAAYHEELKNITDSVELFFTKYTYAQKKAFEGILPFNSNPIRQKRLLPSSAVAYMTPFITKNIDNPNGIFLGINATQDSLLFVDPFTISNDSMRNSNMNILGVSGSGKSVTSKIIATRLFMRGTQILVIDPEGEYLDYAKAMNGEVLQFSRENGINPFSIYSNDKNDILDHILVLKSFFKFFIRPQCYDATVLDNVLVSLYEKFPKEKPTYKGFLVKLKGTTMYDDLKILDKGSLQGVFNSERELELGNDLVVFDISPLKDTEMKAPAMYLLTSLIWQLVDRNREKRKMLFIDEAHNLLVDREVAVFYRKVVKEARKRNLGVVSITQNVEDFLDSEWGNGIITNSETKILLKQSYASLPLMEKVAPMTEEEKMMLGNLPVGDFVLIREQEHIHAYMYVLPFEESFVYTNPKAKEYISGISS